MTNKKEAVKLNIKADDLKEIEGKLLTEKTMLEGELEKFARPNPDNPDKYEAQIEDVGDDESETVSEVEQYTLDLSLGETLEKSLRDVNKALDSIKKGTYGICKYCKNPIDIARLKVRPTSTACIPCKNKLKAL